MRFPGCFWEKARKDGKVLKLEFINHKHLLLEIERAIKETRGYGGLQEDTDLWFDMLKHIIAKSVVSGGVSEKEHRAMLRDRPHPLFALID